MFKKFWKSEDGNYTAIFSIAILPIMSGVAGLVDFASTSTGASKLQESLDATALAIATAYHSGMTDAQVQQYGTDIFGANIRRLGVIFDTDGQTLVSGAYDKVVDFAATAAPDGETIDISATARLMHRGFIGWPTTWQALRHSYVHFMPGQPACLLALDEHASDAVKIQGSTQVKLNGCVIAANSNAIDAVYRGGSAQLDAKCVSTVGDTTGLGGSSVHLDCGQPLEHQYPSLDPLAGVTPPAYTSCKSLPGGKTKSLSPGTWCNKTWSGDITLSAGTYILRGGSIKLGGGGSLVGHGVTIFLMEDADFQMNANETIDLSPPASGAYAGITIFQDKADIKNLTINGTVGSAVTGFIYAPTAHVFYAGNSTMSGAGDCIRIVGNTVEMTGNSDVSASCDAALGGRKMNAGRRILLVQ